MCARDGATRRATRRGASPASFAPIDRASRLQYSTRDFARDRSAESWRFCDRGLRGVWRQTVRVGYETEAFEIERREDAVLSVREQRSAYIPSMHVGHTKQSFERFADLRGARAGDPQ